MTHEKTYENIASYRRSGYRLEKEGLLKEAIEAYSSSIEMGESLGCDIFYAYRFSYDMAILIARQLNQVETEKKLLVAILRHNLLPQERDMYNQRYQTIQ